MHIFLYLSEIFSEKSTTTLVFFSLYSLVFSVYSYDIFNIRIFLLTSGDSWYLPSGAEKTGLEVLCVLDRACPPRALLRGDLVCSHQEPLLSLSFLFSWPESPEKNLAISSLESVCQASSLHGKRAWAVFKFSWILLFLMYLSSPQNQPSLFFWGGE